MACCLCAFCCFQVVICLVSSWRGYRVRHTPPGPLARPLLFSSRFRSISSFFKSRSIVRYQLPQVTLGASSSSLLHNPPCDLQNSYTPLEHRTPPTCTAFFLPTAHLLLDYPTSPCHSSSLLSSMGRRKIEIKAIKDDRNRSVYVE